MKKLTFTGVLPPVTTPFIDGELAVDKLKVNLERYNKTRLSGYLILGSNGENVFLNESEKLAVLEAAREAIPPDKMFMAGTGMESTRETMRWTREAARIGADCALIVTPCYFKAGMTPTALRGHFHRVAEEAEIPVLLYNVPQFTGVNMGADLVAELSLHPNIVGIKDSSGNITQLSAIIRNTSPDFAVFVGAAPVFFPALCMGAVGGILAVANVIPDSMVEIQTLHDAGKYDEARDLQQLTTPLSQWVTVTHGIGGVKMAMDESGYFGGEPRLPLQPPAESFREEVRKMLQAVS